MDNEYQIKTPEDFSIVVSDIISWYKKSGYKNLIIALKGDLGAGKTTFTQTLGKYLKVDEVINSPTFTVVKQYSLEGGLFEQLVHIDAYRIEDASELGPLKMEEVLNKPKTVICIEWPEMISSVIPKDAVNLNIELEENQIRQVYVVQKTE